MFTQEQLAIIRQCVEEAPIKGTSARFIAPILYKLDGAIERGKRPEKVADISQTEKTKKVNE
jgi:hypothetical protein